MGQQSLTITGRLGKTFNYSEKTGMSEFSIIPEKIMTELQDGAIRCCGHLASLSSGMPIQVSGSFDSKQTFLISSVEIPTHTKENTIAFLNYITDKLTEAQENAIAELCHYDLFEFCQRDDALELLEQTLSKSKRGDQIASQIYHRIRGMDANRETEETLLKYNIPIETTMRLLKKGETIETIRRNPYVVLLNNDISIDIVDAFAQQECNIAPYDLIRLKGLVYSALRNLLNCGNTCCTIAQLELSLNNKYQRLLNGQHVGIALLHMCITNMPTICKYHEMNGEAYIYINHVWQEECIAVSHFRRIGAAAKKYKTNTSVEDTEKALGFQYNNEQRAAFRLLQTGGVKILTGPPGSGKTATIKGLIHNFEENHNGTAKLAATTGMAARVIRASTGRESETAHMMLHLVPFNDTIRGRDLNDPVDADLIIVDEVSMMGLQLFSGLIQAVKNGAILLLVGDEDQLQSVDYGNVLHDLIHSGAVETYRLTHVMRQSGSIRINADRINHGNRDMVLDDRFCIKQMQEDTLVSQIISDYDPFRSQVICPIKNGPTGTRHLNQLIQDEVNGTNDVIATCGKTKFRYQDKVILTKTNYDADYVNGDLGTVVDCDDRGGLIISYHAGLLHLQPENFIDLDLAYAMTIHKAQGSEFDLVQIVLPEQARNMMTRRLLHTAVSRAKEKVIVYNEKSAFDDAIKNRAEKQRMTTLSSRLASKAELSSAFV